MFVISGLIIVILIYLYWELGRFITFAAKINKLPGRRCLGVIGNSLEFIGPSEKVFKVLRGYVGEFLEQRVSRAWLLWVPVVLVYDPEDCESIMGSVVNNQKGFLYNVLHPWLGNGLLTSFGPHWHARRKMLTPAFHFNILQKYLSIFNSKSKVLVEDVKKAGAGVQDVNTLITKYTLDSICETSLGVTVSDCKDGEIYRESLHTFGDICFQRFRSAWMMVEFLFVFTSFYRIQKRALKTLHGFSSEMIAKRRKILDESQNEGFELLKSKRKQVMLDLLVAAQKAGEDIDDNSIREEVDTFMFEGHDTTAVSLCYTLMLLANNRECQDKIYDEIISVFGDNDDDLTYAGLQELRYMEMCIKESLRLYPSVPLISRKLGEDIKKTNGYVIPKGCTILLMIYDLHRRADLYPEPEKFDPERFLPEKVVGRHPYAYIPFSAGPRNCIGQKFASMEMKCALTAILKNYILEPVDTPETIECIMDIVIRSKDPIRVKFVPRK